LRMVASEAAPVDLTEATDERAIVAQTEEDLIREAAAAGDVVIIGRGAHVILQDHPHVVRVRLVADPQVRLRRLVDEGRLTPAARMADVINVDRERDRFVHERFGVASEDALAYDLVVNTTHIPLADVPALIDAAATAILQARQG
jgi:cytidylate kinase